MHRVSRLKCCRCNHSADECAPNKLEFSPVNTLQLIVHSIQWSQGAKVHLCVKYENRIDVERNIKFVFHYWTSSRRKKGQLMRCEHEMRGKKEEIVKTHRAKVNKSVNCDLELWSRKVVKCVKEKIISNIMREEENQLITLCNCSFFTASQLVFLTLCGCLC